MLVKQNNIIMLPAEKITGKENGTILEKIIKKVMKLSSLCFVFLSTREVRKKINDDIV